MSLAPSLLLCFSVLTGFSLIFVSFSVPLLAKSFFLIFDHGFKSFLGFHCSFDLNLEFGPGVFS